MNSLKGGKLIASASLVTEESNDELAQFTTGAHGIASTDIRNALSLPMRPDAPQYENAPQPSASKDRAATNLLSEVHEQVSFTEPEKPSKTYMQRLIDVPVCPTCQRPYMLSQLYFKLLQTAVEGSRRTYYKHFFRQLGCIGSGSFGTVYRVRHQLNAVELGVYAIKIISVGSSRPWLLKALSEVTVLEKLRHQNIVQYHHCWAESYRTALNATEETLHLFILLNYCKGGSLLNLRKSTLNRQMTEEELLLLLFQAASGLAHLHAIGFLSRDIKLGNMLLDGDVPDDDPREYISCIYNDPVDTPDTLTTKQKQELRYKQRQFRSDVSLREHCRQLHYIRKVGLEGLRVRITDFGQVGDGASAGTELYLAPELYYSAFSTTVTTDQMKSNSNESGGDSMNGEVSPEIDQNFIIRDKSFPDLIPIKPKSTQATDVYSLGISFLVLLFDYDEFAALNTDIGDMTYDDYINSHKHQRDLLESITKLRTMYSTELCDLLAAMCNTDPSARPTASAVASFCFSQRLRVFSAPVPVARNTVILNSSQGTLTNAIRLYSDHKSIYAAPPAQELKKECTACFIDQHTVEASSCLPTLAKSSSSSSIKGIQNSEEVNDKLSRGQLNNEVSKSVDTNDEANSCLSDIPHSILRPSAPSIFHFKKHQRSRHTVTRRNKRHLHDMREYKRTASMHYMQCLTPYLLAINCAGILAVIYLLRLLLRKS